MPSCVIIVENLSVPFDRRVWQEAKALRSVGWDVSVICPISERNPERYEVLDGIAIYRHPLWVEARNKLGFLFEYASALFHEGRLLLKIALTRGFDVIQVCNPPDILFLNALPYKLLGKRLVFDHHDLCPELFIAKFGRKGLFHRILLVAERLTMKFANLVISSSETYRRVAMERGRQLPENVVTVYSVLDGPGARRAAPNTELRGNARLVLGYVGIIGNQDGVDQLVRMVHHLINDHGRKDIHAVVVGDGPALADVRKLADDLGVAPSITFTGYLHGSALMSALSTFDIGIIPDPINEYNNQISMNKVFEYSALGIPSVSYDLTETHQLLGATCEFAREATPSGLARACLKLIDDDQIRAERGRAAKALADERFDWKRERGKYIAAFEGLVSPVEAPIVEEEEVIGYVGTENSIEDSSRAIQ